MPCPQQRVAAPTARSGTSCNRPCDTYNSTREAALNSHIFAPKRTTAHTPACPRGCQHRTVRTIRCCQARKARRHSKRKRINTRSVHRMHAYMERKRTSDRRASAPTQTKGAHHMRSARTHQLQARKLTNYRRASAPNTGANAHQLRARTRTTCIQGAQTHHFCTYASAAPLLRTPTR